MTRRHRHRRTVFFPSTQARTGVLPTSRIYALLRAGRRPQSNLHPRFRYNPRSIHQALTAIGGSMRYADMVLGALLVSGCGGAAPPSVAVTGSPVDRAALAGVWDGEYSSAATGRSGIIVFEFNSEGDELAGEVIMVPQDRMPRSFLLGPDVEVLEQYSSFSEILQIERVHVEGGKLTGRLLPYEDPNCQCVVSTDFEGTIDGDTITGTFTVKAASGSVRRGRWRISRHDLPARLARARPPVAVVGGGGYQISCHPTILPPPNLSVSASYRPRSAAGRITQERL